MDQDVGKLMDEETLSKYLPHFGDRVFAKNWTGSTLAEVESNAEKKKTLIECLRAKMKLTSSSQATTISSNHTRPALGLGNKNAARKTRKIELGWMNYQDGYFRQVRRLIGGGTREIIARKDDSVNKILGDGKKMFFHKGKSSKGRVEDFDLRLCVMGSEEPLDGTLTIGALYDTTHHKILQAKSPERSQTAQALTSPGLSPKSSSHTVSRQCCWSSMSSLSSDGPLSNSSPFTHASVPATLISNSTPTSQTSEVSVAQPFNLSPDDEVIVLGDDEVIFLGDDENLSLDVLCDTLIYQPLHSSEQQPSDDVIEVQVDSNLASSTRDCRIIQHVTQTENPKPLTEGQISNLVPTNGDSDASNTT